MVDAHDSKSCLARGVGSSPTSGTNKQMSQLCKQLAIIVYAGRGTRTESRRSPKAQAEDRDEWRSMESERL